MEQIDAGQCNSIAASLKVIGDKWSGLLVRQLTTGPCRFNALQEALPGISPRTLSQRLDSLEEQKVITKTAYAEVPPRVEYALTKKGEDLAPILKSMAAWGCKYKN
jgi:DNA-binding HxlR family transcriptional regulator